jgi:hypothetical protein
MSEQLPDGWIKQPTYAMFRYVFEDAQHRKLVDKRQRPIPSTVIYEGNDGWYLMMRNKVNGPHETPRAAMLAHKMLQAIKKSEQSNESK